ncbi:hypothetical protein SERLADRAFT_481133 [Serpula lacrymans var. lacrymans S7.9]|uniref:Xylanolytic transcriptional activator regulatory domain-containing protein n=1 Tax=Serpula lacrymans var. lacrymans (strain S7.9) TaxID=578457 RepID=F8PEL0_SERL9|nr:uncharacterized protein SERLADRAFT_481133 [Serpula lacrymans var. lacrymans S7.9]EGO18461.1 hypothetical protein SERLADRAFT_481133 [Serpula lacrymans var. lacrymans S7.9]
MESLEDDNNNVGVANKEYFLPGPATDLNIRKSLIEQHSPPDILVHNLVTGSDVDKLFEIFYKHVNPFISLLDPVLHTPESTFARCPFLFTVICAVSSRYYTEKSEIYPIAMHFAKHSAANALIEGWKSVELCQAYILMSIYSVPARRWEEDRSWLYTGLAVRIATDLNLHQVSTVQPQCEREEREILNRTRVWMICFNLDRSTATQFGKPSSVKEDYILRNSKEWYKKSQYNIKDDLHLCAYSSLLRIVGRFHDDIFSDLNTPSGLNKQIDFRSVTLTHDAHLSRYFEEWSKKFAEESDRNDRGANFRCTLLPFLVDYSRLVMFSFGFQHAFTRGIEASDHVFFSKCFDAAKSVIKHMIDVLAPSGYMRYAPDGHFVFVSFASAFLLKMLRPEIRQLLLSQELETEIFDLIARLIHTLSSSEVAIDDRHTPKLYARFLAGLLAKHRKDGAAVVGRLQPLPPQSQTMHRSSASDFQGHGTASSSSGSAFNAPQSYSSTTQDHADDGDYSQMAQTSSKAPTPIYRPEIAFTPGQGQIDFGISSDLAMMDGVINGFSDEEMLATMQAIKNPTWWQNMMMPGFSWPDASAMSPGIDTYNQNIPGAHQGFSGFQTASVAT